MSATREHGPRAGRRTTGLSAAPAGRAGAAVDDEPPESLRLTEASWPIFEFLSNFVRQIKRGHAPPPDQVRYEALSALRDAEDLARNDPATEKAFEMHIKPILVYLLDYKMLNTEWDGRDFWLNNLLEIDPRVLNKVDSRGGEEFFTQCDELQREYDLAERRDRRDRQELGEILSLFYVCLRLGFKGQYHDRPAELADYARRLFVRLPAYANTRTKEMFPQAYQHNQELKVDYKLGLRLSVVLATLAIVLLSGMFAFRYAWWKATADIESAANQVRNSDSHYLSSQPATVPATPGKS